LSFSRLMYVGLSWKPLDTRQFIQLHDEAFRYFGGVPEECVYDQTKLVVLDEQYRELNLNPLFARYATTIGLHIHACEGYDPESKGKVEAGVKYVKQDALYGEEFDSRDAVPSMFRNGCSRSPTADVMAVPAKRRDSVLRCKSKPASNPICDPTASIRMPRKPPARPTRPG
jgi:hypothetical protein